MSIHGIRFITYRLKSALLRGGVSITTSGRSLHSPDSLVRSHPGFKFWRGSGSPEAQLFSLIPDPFGLPDFVIKVDDKVFDELSFYLGSELLNNVSVTRVRNSSTLSPPPSPSPVQGEGGIAKISLSWFHDSQPIPPSFDNNLSMSIGGLKRPGLVSPLIRFWLYRYRVSIQSRFSISIISVKLNCLLISIYYIHLFIFYVCS